MHHNEFIIFWWSKAISDPPWIPDLKFASQVNFLRVGTTVTSYINCSKLKFTNWGLSSSVSGQGRPVTLQSDPHGQRSKSVMPHCFSFAAKRPAPAWPGSVLSCTQGFLRTLLPVDMMTRVPCTVWSSQVQPVLENRLLPVSQGMGAGVSFRSSCMGLLWLVPFCWINLTFTWLTTRKLYYVCVNSLIFQIRIKN